MAKKIHSSRVSDLIEWQMAPGGNIAKSDLNTEKDLEYFGSQLFQDQRTMIWAHGGNAEFWYPRCFTSCRVISRFWQRSLSSLWRTNPSHFRALFSNRWLHSLTGLFVTEETGQISHFKLEEAIVTAIIAGEWEKEIKGKMKAGLLASLLLGSPNRLEFAWCFSIQKAHICIWSQWTYFLFHIMKNIKK